ncbi:hypothetical protein R1flu_018496 [Riccia fluitans]|uniref:GPI inositol-deacylase n=1 Tax=Riccia fluitans TaxID=41844 RepID=A0ABD1ZG06_9MARC
MYPDQLDILERLALIMKDKHLEYGCRVPFPTVRVHPLFVALGRRKGEASGSHISLDVGRFAALPEIDRQIKQDRCVVLVLNGSWPDNESMSNQSKSTKEDEAPLVCKMKSKVFSRSLRVLVLRNVIILRSSGVEEFPQLQCLICSNSNLPFPKGNLKSLMSLRHLEISTMVDDNESFTFPDGVEKIRLENMNVKQFTFGPLSHPGNMKKLKEFGLMNVTNLLADVQIDQFQSLRKLVLADITGLDNNLPAGLFQLKFLRVLSVRNCEHLSLLPEFHNNLLEHIYLALPDLIQLPGTLQNLKSLISLTLENCCLLKQIPAGTGTPSTPNRKLIAVNHCPNLKPLLPEFVKVHSMMEIGVLALQLSINATNEWQFYTRNKLDCTFVEEAFAATQMPALISQQSDYVYEWYKPTEGPVEMDLLFFHGLNLDKETGDVMHVSTWTSTEGSESHVWPKTWLSQDFPRARILAIAYDSHRTQTAEHGRINLHNTAESLMLSLLKEKDWWTSPFRPLILVGHSFGGILIKQLCVHAHHLASEGSTYQREMRCFLKKIKAIMFLGTPHRGMTLPPLEEAAPGKSSPLMEYVAEYNTNAARLHDRFEKVTSIYKWRIAGIGELNETRLGSSSCLLVSEASARHGDFYFSVPADHVSLSKPQGKYSLVYRVLTMLIEDPFSRASATPS